MLPWLEKGINMNDVLLEMKEINKSYSGVQVLHNVNLKVRKGEIHALMGENGAGKSTLIKIITGIVQADSGEKTYKGELLNISHHLPKYTIMALVSFIRNLTCFRI